MCGRYTLTRWERAMIEGLGVHRLDLDRFKPNERGWNIAPTQYAPVIWADDQGRRADLFRWGMIPSWSPSIPKGSPLINARAETIAAKSPWKIPLTRGQRCIVMADGYYEWKTLPDGTKQPYHIHLLSDETFAVAGLWDAWTNPQGETIRSFAIVTTAADSSISRVHDRMPAILVPEHAHRWLDPATPQGQLPELLTSFSTILMRLTPVSTRVNSVANNHPGLKSKIALPPEAAP